MIKRTNFLAPVIRTLLAVFLYLQSPGAHAQEPAYINDSLLEASAVNASLLLQRSGLAEQIGWLPAAMASSFDDMISQEIGSTPFEPADVPFLKKSVASNFSAQAIEAAVAQELDASLSKDEISHLIQFYDSDEGRILRQAELDNSVLTNTSRFEAWHAAAGYNSLPVERQNVLSELERAMQATQGSVDAMIGMQVAMQIALTPALPEDEQLSPAQLLNAAERLRAFLTSVYQQSTLESLAFIFQKQSLDELISYTRLLETGTGQRYVKASNDGLNRGLFNAAEKLGLSIGSLLSVRSGRGI